MTSKISKMPVRKLRSMMTFAGYASKDLDVIEQRFVSKFSKAPTAFMARSPFEIMGNMANKKKLVISKRHCGYNAVFVPLQLNKTELEEAIYALGEASQKIYVDRRKAEKDAKLNELKKKNTIRTYMRHCMNCGKQYITDAQNPQSTCGADNCKTAHKKYIALQKEMGQKIIKKQTKLLDDSLNMDTPSHSSLQGYIYVIRAENGLCKIGRSGDVESRFGEVVCLSPISVFLLHTIFSDNYVLAESYIHKRLADYRHHGEWFDLPKDILTWVLALDNYDLDLR